MISASKTAGVVQAEMLMIRAGGWRGLFVLVEGPDDASFWVGHLKIRREAIIIAEGVINLRDCMSSLPPTLSGDVCAISDQDFKAFLPADPFAGCIDTFFYDEGFLETFLLNSPALRKLIGIHSDKSKITGFEAKNKPHTVYSYLRQICSLFGQLRVLSLINSWGLPFEKGLTPYKYLDHSSWNFREDDLLGDAAAHVGLARDALKSSCDALGVRGQIRLLHGHDTLKALAIGLNGCLGGSKVGEDRLRSDLMLAFESAYLEPKLLVRALRKWAGKRQLI